MGKGIQIKKPESVAIDQTSPEALLPKESLQLSPFDYLMLLLTFPASAVAIYFFLQTRSV